MATKCSNCGYSLSRIVLDSASDRILVTCQNCFQAYEECIVTLKTHCKYIASHGCIYTVIGRKLFYASVMPNKAVMRNGANIDWKEVIGMGLDKEVQKHLNEINSILDTDIKLSDLSNR